MGQIENDVKQKILEACGHGDVRLWNHPVGGMSVNDRFYKFGMGKGASDLIGIKRRVIRIEDIGKVLGQFIAIEVKTDIGQASEEQLNFINVIRQFGGLAGIARNPTQAKVILESWELFEEYR